MSWSIPFRLFLVGLLSWESMIYFKIKNAIKIKEDLCKKTKSDWAYGRSSGTTPMQKLHNMTFLTPWLNPPLTFKKYFPSLRSIEKLNNCLILFRDFFHPLLLNTETTSLLTPSTNGWIRAVSSIEPLLAATVIQNVLANYNRL